MAKVTTVLVLGASGMLGHAVLRYFHRNSGYTVIGSVRTSAAMGLLPGALHDQIVCGVEAENTDSLLQLFTQVRPDVVINCIGLVKQLAGSNAPLVALPINALLPHRLLHLCKVSAARLVQVSTDCVFAGSRGMYREDDVADAKDLYGLSKFLGEVDDPQAVTLRTSIIGPELNSAHGLLAWFLSKGGQVKGFTRAIFSGLPTVELARVMCDVVLPRADLRGVYHVAADPISKYDLLSLIARVYDHAIDIEPDGELEVNRSLDSRRFRQVTGYVSPSWPELVRAMRDFG